MDLNLLYAQQQISLLRAGSATSRLQRTRYLASAGAAANRIRDFQLAQGAPAAAGWLACMENQDLPRTATWSAAR
jgi:hypothetical protein